MKVYLQLGHGMQALSQDLIKSWGAGTAIISPVNMSQNKIAAYAKKIRDIGGEVLFDPQMFYPKEGHVKLQAYDYWPSDGCSVTSEDVHANINRELLRINKDIDTSQIILPGIEMREDSFGYNLEWIKKIYRIF